MICSLLLSSGVAILSVISVWLIAHYTKGIKPSRTKWFHQMGWLTLLIIIAVVVAGESSKNIC